MTPVVALALLRWVGAGAVEVRIIALDPGEDPEAAAAACLGTGKVDVIGALSKVVSLEYLSSFVPGIARCPAVVWIGVREEDRDSYFGKSAGAGNRHDYRGRVQ